MRAALVVFWMASGVLPALGVLMASARARRRSKGAQGSHNVLGRFFGRRDGIGVDPFREFSHICETKKGC